MPDWLWATIIVIGLAVPVTGTAYGMWRTYRTLYPPRDESRR